MKYAYIALLVLSCVFGGYLGRKFFPRTELREVPTTVTKTHTVTKEVIKQADGTVIERVVTQTKDRVKVSPQPPQPQYRAGILMPLSNDRLPTVSASKRLFSDVWVDAQYDLRHKEVTVGLSYEF